jgi:superfamily I DNA/RNA helicase
MTLVLNTEQQACVNAIDGDYVVISGPGSGKTTVLVARHLEMVGRRVIPSKDILNLTFTNSAADEMANRTGLLDAKENFRTFHSYALDLVKREKQHLSFTTTDAVIPVYGQDFQLLRDLMKVYPAITTFRSLQDKLAEWKRSNIDPEEAIDFAFHNGIEFWYACAYRDYEKKCREQGWLDFDSLMKETVKLLETNDEVRLRNQRKYLCVDECQDTDVVQFQLLKLIYGGNIFVVGDENQLIYEWRSAVAGNLTNFAKTFPGATTLYLGQNYRSTKRLVEFFRKILPIDNGIASHMLSERGDGISPTITSFADDIQEVGAVLGEISDLNNTAIIARTNRQLRVFQKACIARNIKSMILGEKDLWQKPEIKHLLDLTKERKQFGRPAHEVMTEVMNEHNLAYLYHNTGGPYEKPPVENLNDLIGLAAKRGTVAEFLEWLRKLTYACEAAKNPAYAHRDKNPVLTLTTVHQAKGREWKHVYVVGCKQGIMPHKDGEPLEEKRIFFVGCSRAADTLHVSFYGNRSEYLNEFRKEIKEYDSKNI